MITLQLPYLNSDAIWYSPSGYLSKLHSQRKPMKGNLSTVIALFTNASINVLYGLQIKIQLKECPNFSRTMNLVSSVKRAG